MGDTRNGIFNFERMEDKHESPLNHKNAHKLHETILVILDIFFGQW